VDNGGLAGFSEHSKGSVINWGEPNTLHKSLGWMAILVLMFLVERKYHYRKQKPCFTESYNDKKCEKTTFFHSHNIVNH
jgi:hypothetical protein